VYKQKLRILLSVTLYRVSLRTKALQPTQWGALPCRSTHKSIATYLVERSTV